MGKLTSSPKAGKDEELLALTRKDRILNILGISAVGVCILFLVIMLSSPQPAWRYVSIFGVLLLVCLVSLALNRVGRFSLAALLFLLGLTFAIMGVVLQSFLVDQVRTPTVFYFSWVVLAAGVLLGARASLGFATLSAFLILITGPIGSAALPVEDMVGDLVPAAVLGYLMALVAWLYSNSLEKALHQLAERSRALEAANQEIHTFSRTLEGQVQERTRELRDFMAMVAHDLRNPLTTVQGYTEMLQEECQEDMGPRQRRALNTIVASVQHMIGLTEDLVYLGHLRAGTARFDVEPLPIEYVVREACEGFERRLAEKKLDLRLDLPAELPFVLGDRLRLTQVLNNLVGNALNYTPSGEIVVGARPINGFVEINVSDTGIGIPPEEQDILFTHIARGKHKVVHNSRGTGLGLIISSFVVKAHGGEIWVESDENKGSTFSFTVPIVTPVSTEPTNIDVDLPTFRSSSPSENPAEAVWTV